MIQCIDFVPHELQKPGFLKAAVMEELKDCLSRANTWIEKNDIEVINIETVVLPNMHHPYEKGSKDTNLRVSDDFSAYWYQFIRIWYK